MFKITYFSDYDNQYVTRTTKKIFFDNANNHSYVRFKSDNLGYIVDCACISNVESIDDE